MARKRKLMLVAAPKQIPAKDFADQLSDAYSTDRYRNGWNASIAMLRRRRYTDREIEAIIRSKHTRWAADHASKPYGCTTSRDLENYIVRHLTAQEVAELVRETF
jgi:hypothetical protein